MLPYQPRDKAEVFMPLISEQYSVVATNSIRLSDWPLSHHLGYASKSKTVVNLEEAEKPQRTKIVLKWFLKTLFHFGTSMSCNPVTSSVSARSLLGF